MYGHFTAVQSFALNFLFPAATASTITVKGLQEGEMKQLKNPDNVSKEAIESGLELYRKVMKCDDPAIKGAVHQAVQVRAKGKRPHLFNRKREYDCLMNTPCRSDTSHGWPAANVLTISNFNTEGA